MDLYLKLSDKEYESVLKNVASTPQGLKFIGHLIACDLDSANGFQGNSRDVYLKGKSEHSLKLFDDMRLYAFESFQKLLQEDFDARFEAEVKAKKRKEQENDE